MSSTQAERSWKAKKFHWKTLPLPQCMCISAISLSLSLSLSLLLSHFHFHFHYTYISRNKRKRKGDIFIHKCFCLSLLYTTLVGCLYKQPCPGFEFMLKYPVPLMINIKPRAPLKNWCFKNSEEQILHFSLSVNIYEMFSYPFTCMHYLCCLHQLTLQFSSLLWWRLYRDVHVISLLDDLFHLLSTMS